MSDEGQLDKLLQRIESLENRVSKLELKKSTIIKRPFQWQDKIMYSLELIGRPTSKKEVRDKVIDLYPTLLEKLDKQTVLYRLSSSYKKMVTDGKLVFIKSKTKGEPVLVGKRSWFEEGDKYYQPVKEWFLSPRNEDYEYVRLE